MKQKGFTLIELLVVISIISLLASVVLAALNSARAKARDAVRLQDMQQIQTALEEYYDQYGQYPNSDNEGCGDWSSSGDVDFITPLRTAGFLPKNISDPTTNTNCGNFYYYRYPAGYAGCDPSRGAFYVLSVGNMETSGLPYPTSPGWSCPGEDWQTFFEWVTGKFEN